MPKPQLVTDTDTGPEADPTPPGRIVTVDYDGHTYTYVVSDILEVPMNDLSVTGPTGTDTVSLQTCIEDYGDYWTPGPNWNVRYIVRGTMI